MKSKRLLLPLIIFLVASRLATLSIPPLTDTSEARYAELAKIMVLTGNWFVPQVWLDGELVPFEGKPPLGFWMMAASMKIFGANEFSARLPSAACSIALLFLMFAVLKHYSTEYIAWTAVCVTGTSACFYIFSGVSLVDPVLTFFSMGAVFLYFAFLKEDRDKTRKILSMAVFIFLALAFLTKGPVGLVYFGVPAFCWTLLSGRWATLKNHSWIIGGVVFIAITGICFTLLENAMPGFLNYFFVHENFLRFVSKNYGDRYSAANHALPWGTAVPFTLLACAPWILLPLHNAFSVVRRRKNDKALDDDADSANGNTHADGHPISIKTRLAASISGIRNKSRRPEAIFPIGLISLTLFWSFSKHLMFYYFVTMVPLFGAWLAVWMRKTDVPLRKTARGAMILMAAYSALTIPVARFLDLESSARGVLREVEELPEVDGSTRVVFVRRVPYSAYFYGGEKVLPHAEESIPKSALKALDEKNAVLVSLNRYEKGIPQGFRQKFILKIEKGKWTAAILKRWR